MKVIYVLVLDALLALSVAPSVARAQMPGGFGGRPGRGGGEETPRPSDPFGPRPEVPGPELEGPPDSTTLRQLIGVNDEQAKRYQQVYDSFMAATRPQRDSAQKAARAVREALARQELDAMEFHSERLKGLDKYLRDRQKKFEDGLSAVFTPQQMKDYKRWKKAQEDAAKAKREEMNKGAEQVNRRRS
jgi:hypothetical protein